MRQKNNTGKEWESNTVTDFSKKAVLFQTIFPLFAALFIYYALAWGAWPASLHILYGFSFALLLRQVLFWKYRKIPFSCVTVPGRSRLQYLWLVYGQSFLVSVSAFSTLERALFRNPTTFLIYYAAAFGLAAGLDVYQRLFVYEKIRLLYEDKPDRVMITLVGFPRCRGDVFLSVLRDSIPSS